MSHSGNRWLVLKDFHNLSEVTHASLFIYSSVFQKGVFQFALPVNMAGCRDSLLWMEGGGRYAVYVQG